MTEDEARKKLRREADKLAKAYAAFRTATLKSGGRVFDIVRDYSESQGTADRVAVLCRDCQKRLGQELDNSVRDVFMGLDADTIFEGMCEQILEEFKA